LAHSKHAPAISRKPARGRMRTGVAGAFKETQGHMHARTHARTHTHTHAHTHASRTYFNVAMRNHVAHELPNVCSAAAVADANREPRPVHRNASRKRHKLILLFFAVMCSSGVAFSFLAIRKTHGHRFQRAHRAHDVCRRNSV
jgi:hypothetical protein